MPDAPLIVTGASGYAGRLVTAALLARTDAALILPVRESADRSAALSLILDEATLLNHDTSRDGLSKRIRFAPIEGLGDWLDDQHVSRISEVQHCAGCVDYFDEDKLYAGNVLLTQQMLEVARRFDADQFVFISTAFACGDRGDALIPETLHKDGDGEDLTAYMASKRHAERLVAESGVPYLILRPPILLGNSVDGRYCGKPYGIVQLWEGWSRLILSAYREEMYFVVPPGVMPPLLHQDHFQNGVLAAREHATPGSVIHMVPSAENSVATRDLYLAAVKRARPQRVFLYQDQELVPRDTLYRAARTFLDFCAVNIEISGKDWRFERENMARLESQGMETSTVSAETVDRCFNHFAANSRAMQRYFKKHGDALAERVDIIDVP